MKAPRRTSSALAQIDAEANAKAQRLVARIKGAEARAKAKLAELALQQEAAKLRGEPCFAEMPIDQLVTVLKARQRAVAAETVSQRRRATVQWMSIAGQSVQQIADATGMTYLSVVQLRRQLGVSRKRRPK